MSQLYEYLDAVAGEQLALLERLVNIDSGTDDKAGVDQVGAVLRPLLAELGLAVETVPQTSAGDHLIGRKSGTPGRDVLLVGHMDTVYPKGTVRERPFRGEGGRAYGPGVLDMKGGLTVILLALRALQSQAPAAWERLGIRVVFNSDEETDSGTSRTLIAWEAARARCAGVLEPARPGGEYVSSRKGMGTFRLKVFGKAAHAGTQPELGANAAVALAHKILALHELNDHAAGVTVNVGVIAGGTRPNVVPDAAECQIDVRVPALADMGRVQAAMQAIADAEAVPGTRAELTVSFETPPMEYTAEAERLYGLVARAAAEVGFAVRTVATGGGSDGNTTAQHTATLDGMGPRGNFAHSPNEYIEVDSLAERTKILARFLELWAQEAV